MTKNNSSNMGRQKIRMAKIGNKNHLQVTFSKRRAGLFKKASELCTLCGVDVSIIVFSPAKKVFSFGHPQVESIVDRFLSSRTPPLPTSTSTTTTTTDRLVEAHRNASIHELNMQLIQLLDHLEIEKKKGEALDKIWKASQHLCWWHAPIDELGLNELKKLRIALEELKENVAKQANKVLVESANNTTHWKLLPFDCNVIDHHQHQPYGYGIGQYGIF